MAHHRGRDINAAIEDFAQARQGGIYREEVLRNLLELYDPTYDNQRKFFNFDPPLWHLEHWNVWKWFYWYQDFIIVLRNAVFFHFRNMDVSNFPDMKSFADKLAKMAPGESLKVENVPADQIMKVKMNMTLSGYIQVNVAGNTVSGSKPNVSPIFFSLF